MPLKLEFDDPFVFDDKLYEYDMPFMSFYGGGNYRFLKHFLGPNRIPAFDGKGPNGEGEEYECARAIDQSPKVKTWLRNADRRTGSFRLPLAEHWFYPDFVGVLNDDRLFVVEYKGGYIISEGFGTFFLCKSESFLYLCYIVEVLPCEEFNLNFLRLMITGREDLCDLLVFLSHVTVCSCL